MQTDLPARPDLPFRAEFTEPPAPKKRSKWAIIGSIVGGLIVLGAIQGVIEGSDQDSTTTPNPITVPDSGTTREQAMSLAAPALDQAAGELGQITQTSAISSDVVHMNRAADYLDQAAAFFIGVDETQYGYLSSAADHERAAADAYEELDFVRFQAEANAANADLQAAVDAV